MSDLIIEGLQSQFIEHAINRHNLNIRFLIAILPLSFGEIDGSISLACAVISLLIWKCLWDGEKLAVPVPFCVAVIGGFSCSDGAVEAEAVFFDLVRQANFDTVAEGVVREFSVARTEAIEFFNLSRCQIMDGKSDCRSARREAWVCGFMIVCDHRDCVELHVETLGAAVCVAHREGRQDMGVVVVRCAPRLLPEREFEVGFFNDFYVFVANFSERIGEIVGIMAEIIAEFCDGAVGRCGQMLFLWVELVSIGRRVKAECDVFVFRQGFDVFPCQKMGGVPADCFRGDEYGRWNLVFD